MAKKKTARRAPRQSAGRAGRWRPGWRWPLKVGLVLFVLLACGLIYLDARVRHSFSGSKWAVPARVYARPLELFAGKPLRQDDFEQELRQLGYRFVDRARNPGEVSRQGRSYQLHTRGFRFWDGDEARTQASLSFGRGSLTSLRTGSGSALLRMEPLQIGSIYPAHNEDRILVRIDEVPELLKAMLLVMEDRNFYQHAGVSPEAIARAAWANLRSRRVVQGGSTLTQQLVKNYYLSADRSLTRKAIEAVMALSLDFHFSKDEILEAYINEIFLGQDGPRAIHGFGLASQYYFNRPMGDLELHQLALLTALVRGASYYDPWRNPERALARRNLVLQTMNAGGYIDDAALEQASLEPLDVGKRYAAARRRYPAYLDLVRRQLRRDYAAEDLSSEGLNIFTHLDPVIQLGAERALTATIGRLAAHHGKLDDLQGALVVSQPESGSVLAIVGGREARFAGFNRALDAVRPIGSLVKPAVYLAALESGFTLASVLPDEPLQVALPNGDIWAPRNFDRVSHGPTPLFVALARSYNQAAAWLGMELGIDRVARMLAKLGVERELLQVPSLALGSGGLSVLEVTQAYQTIAADGFYTPLKAIQAVTSADGERLNQYRVVLNQRVARDAVYQLQSAMYETASWGTGRVVRRYLAEDFSVAVKTGTSDDHRDSWFAGFSGDLLSVVWLGRDNNGAMPLTGGSGAGQVWGELFHHHARQPLQRSPGSGIGYQWIDPATGLLGNRCEGARYLPFVAGSAPTERAPCYRDNRWFKRIFE